MSEIYRLMKSGEIPPLEEGEECDMLTNPLVDDCRGEICKTCREDKEVG